MASACISQNLVPNPSFEEYNVLHCGNTQTKSDFNNATVYWTMPTNATPDLYSNLVDVSCGNHPFAKSQQATGSQDPKDGDFMVGLITYSERTAHFCHDYSEYIQVKLIEPLITGTTYHVGFYVSLADKREFASNNMGMLFTELPITSDTCDFLDLKPQYNSTKVITDSENWTFVNGSFLANDFSEYLTIGNFISDEKTTTTYIYDNPIFSSSTAYYYLDSVFVEPVEDLEIPNVFTPNQDEHNQSFFIKNLQENRWSLTISNRWGQQVYQSRYYNNEWDGKRLRPSVYYYYVKHRYVNIEYKGEVTILK